MSIFARIANALTSDVTVFIYDGANVTLRKGRVSSHVVRALQSTLQNANSPRATISIRKNGRVQISNSIDPALHQRIRNIVLEG